MDENNVVGIIFDIQRYSLHDGPGIRTLVFVKGCSLRCKWCANPEGLDTQIDITSDPIRCIGCGRCQQVCPKRAISVTEKGFSIDREQCSHCGKCAEVCPSGSKQSAGEIKTAAEIVKKVKRDMVFYKSSGGGLTMGGGEILMQPEFVYEILRECQNQGINTAIETSAFGKWEDLERIISVTDNVFMDLKAVDDELHLRLTGVHNSLILSNIRRTDELFRKKTDDKRRFVIRIPVIPGMNDSSDCVERAASFIETLSGYAWVELLPFHNFGENKYTKLDRAYSFHGVKNSSADEMLPLLEIMRKHGIETKINTW